MDEFIMDVNDPNLTLTQIFGLMNRYQSEHPEMDVFLDGDRRAIMGRRHIVR